MAKKGKVYSTPSPNNNYNKDTRPQSDDHKQHTSPSKHSVNNEKAPDVPRNEEMTRIFPEITPLLVFAVTLTFRVMYVLDPKNWWMVHPDEVYQSVEVAHIQVYGYGFLAYDFSSPETDQSDVTGYRQMELDAAMFAIRSPIFPHFYVLVSRLACLVGIQSNPYLLWRLSHVTVTSFLPLAVYLYVLKFHRLKDTANVAAVLVASSAHINVFSTHCLIHSFMAPLTFFALSLLIDNSSQDSPVIPTHGWVIDPADFGPLPFGSTTHNQANPMSPEHTKRTKTDSNFYNSQFNFNNKNSHQNKTSQKNKEIDRKSNSLGLHKNRENGTKINAHFASKKYQNYADKNVRFIQTTLAVFLATITCYIRPDASLIYLANCVSFPEMQRFLNRTNLTAILLGGLGALAAGIGADFNFYSQGISSCFNWVYFNVILNQSTVMFGNMGSWFYLEKFFFYDVGIMTLSLCATICALLRFLIDAIHTMFTSIKNENTNLFRNTRKSLFTWFIPLMAYFCKGHKETRFINDVIILVFIFIADFLVNLRHVLQSRTSGNNLIRLIVILFIATQWRSFPSNTDNGDWVYHKTASVEGVNLCIKFISEQNDVTGVFYDANLHMTGGISLLHRDVPVFSLAGRGFYEFGPESRRNGDAQWTTFRTTPADKTKPTEAPSRRSVYQFSRASNYISLPNAQAVVRVLIQKQIYNYLVLRRDRKFLDFGFVEVFRTDHSRVLKRQLDERSESMLHGLLDKIPVGTNSTALLHEGDVLYNMDQFKEAATRFNRALSLDEGILGAYLPLQSCYSRLGDEQAASAVRDKCISLFGEVACSSPRKISLG